MQRAESMKNRVFDLALNAWYKMSLDIGYAKGKSAKPNIMAKSPSDDAFEEGEPPPSRKRPPSEVKRRRDEDDYDDDDDDRPRRRRRQPEGDDGLSTLIPYKNGMALAAYYCGVFSLIPCIGGILSIIALFLGIGGLRYAKKNPQAKGTAHAVIGIVLGALVLVTHLIIGGLIVVGIMMEKGR